MQCYEVLFKNGERLMDVGSDEQDVWDYMRKAFPEKGQPVKVQLSENWRVQNEGMRNQRSRPALYV